MSQKAFAQLAGVSLQCVAKFEKLRKLRGSQAILIRIALAAQQPVENLMAPRLLHAIQADIEGRRVQMGYAAGLHNATPS